MPSSLTWPATIWIGGAPGAGKSTLAWDLSRRCDLPLHPIDLWTFDHAARLPPPESLDDALARGAVHAADSFRTYSEARLALVRDDIWQRGLGMVPALLEGPQLYPRFFAEGGLAPDSGVWIIPAPAQTRSAREARLRAAPDARSRERLEAILARDLRIAAEIERECGEMGLPVLYLPASPNWAEFASAVELQLRPALLRGPRLEPGASLARQRRIENQTAARQGRLWWEATGLKSVPPYPFACECGGSGCRDTWSATPDAYAERERRGPLDLHREPS